ncbi:hypothetical protein L3V59_32850 [Burkholderia aenigmatica]|uniref:hypothetical protein n=1 Tax=Burkholderia aenigmatica TaxID=2015348 RepID=UPI001F3227BD|nr:hypothetical protein [Burkholderia aenigmatica]UKD14456.1 hypothetical protein L3V59_32850 [Burkholderia aenigmatica]
MFDVDGSGGVRQRTPAAGTRQASRERRGGGAGERGESGKRGKRGECCALACEAGCGIGRATLSHGVSSGGQWGRSDDDWMTPMVLAAWENTNAASGQLF